ncbi:MAG: GGDEF domain-containing protein [Planctomycetaceae bacterium]
MPVGSLIYIVVGALLAVGLMAIGAALGYLRAKRTARVSTDEIDRHAMLQLLRELGNWTSEYSGNVSQYQSRIGELAELAKRLPGGSAKGDAGVGGLLGDIMQSNSQLQKRLDAAEKQLDKQTRMIESYLMEARTDSLTKLANRRAFDDKIEELFNAYRKGGKSFVLAMIDIDHFKKINDTLGHPAGDEVLRQVASVLRQSIESPYLLARYGGEEFAVLMPGPLRVAADRIDAMRRRVATEPLKIMERTISITLSAGLTEPRDEVVQGALIRRADESLYAAKNIGRNRVYYHDGRQSTLVGAPEVATSL